MKISIVLLILINAVYISGEGSCPTYNYKDEQQCVGNCLAYCQKYSYVDSKTCVDKKVTKAVINESRYHDNETEAKCTCGFNVSAGKFKACPENEFTYTSMKRSECQNTCYIVNCYTLAAQQVKRCSLKDLLGPAFPFCDNKECGCTFTQMQDRFSMPVNIQQP